MIKSPNQIKWSLEKSLKQKGDFQSVCVALIRLLVSIGLMMSDVWGYQPESKVRLSPAKIFPEIKQPDLMPLTVWGQSLMISLCLLQESERTQCWKLGLFFLHLLLQSEALFCICPGVNLRRNEVGSLPVSPRRFPVSVQVCLQPLVVTRICLSVSW